MMKRLLVLATLVLTVFAAASAKDYGINVGGKEVSDNNKSGVTGGDIKSGTVVYNSSTNTLTLTNVTITRTGNDDYGIHNRSCTGLKIVFAGKCSILAKYEAIKCQKKTTVTVTGTTDLRSTRKHAVYLDQSDITFNGEGTLNIFTNETNQYGVEGNKGTESATFVVKTANVDGVSKLKSLAVNSRSSSGAVSSTLTITSNKVKNVTTFTPGSGVHVMEPAGASFSSNGFYDGSRLTTSNVVISDERDNPLNTTVGNFCYYVSGDYAVLAVPTVAYRLSRPTRLDIPGFVTLNGKIYPVKIGYSAFNNCMPALTNVYITYGVEEIGGQAFGNCTYLENITIPSSVKTVGAAVFKNDAGLTNIYWANLDLRNVSMTGLSSGSNENCWHYGINGQYYPTVHFPTTDARDKANSGGKIPSNYARAVTPSRAHDFPMNGHGQYCVVTKAGIRGTNGEMAIVGGTSGNVNYTPTFYHYTSDDGNGAVYECTSIAPYAFYKNTAISGKITITAPYLKTIGEAAYLGTNITEVNTGSYVTGIGTSAFVQCPALETVTLGDGVTSIGQYAFGECSKLKTVTIGNKLTTIPNGAFQQDPALTVVTIGSAVTNINSASFSSSPNITTVQWNAANYPYSGTTGLLSSIFGSNLTTVYFGNTVQTIPNYACDGLTKLVSISFGDSNSALTTIGNYAFQRTAITHAYLPNTVTTIGTGAFRNNQNLFDVRLGSGLQTIGSAAFDLTDITDITLPESLITIGSGAFSQCTKLTEISIPSKVKKIDYRTFWYCSALEKVYIGAGVEKIEYNAFENTNLKNIRWNATNYDLRNMANNADEAPFRYNKSTVTEVWLGAGVNAVPSYLCYGFENLEKLVVLEPLKYVFDYAFYGCKKLLFAGNWGYMADGASIGESAFEKSGITTLERFGNVKTIYKSAFSGCTNLGKVEFSGNYLEQIGESAFDGCTGIASVDLENTSLKTIPKFAFNGCSALESVTLPESVTEIGDMAFQQCRKLNTINSPEALTTLGLGAFGVCSSLKKFTLPAGFTSMGNMAFMGCNGLTNFYSEPRCEDIKMGNNVFLSASTASCTLHVKPSCVSAYENADQWKDFYIIEGDLEDDGNPYDVNGDGEVNVGDVNYVLNLVLAEKYEAKADVNNDGSVNVGDVNAILNTIFSK